jgi:hypothetical protein
LRVYVPSAQEANVSDGGGAGGEKIYLGIVFCMNYSAYGVMKWYQERTPRPFDVLCTPVQGQGWRGWFREHSAQLLRPEPVASRLSANLARIRALRDALGKLIGFVWLRFGAAQGPKKTRQCCQRALVAGHISGEFAAPNGRKVQKLLLLVCRQIEKAGPAFENGSMFGRRNQSALQLAPIARVNPKPQAALPEGEPPVNPQLLNQFTEIHTRRQ